MQTFSNLNRPTLTYTKTAQPKRPVQPIIHTIESRRASLNIAGSFFRTVAGTVARLPPRAIRFVPAAKQVQFDCGRLRKTFKLLKSYWKPQFVSLFNSVDQEIKPETNEYFQNWLPVEHNINFDKTIINPNGF